jgi:hypothetical protein
MSLPPAETSVLEWRPRRVLRLPAKLLLPVPVERNIPAVSILLVAWMPLDEVSEPEKELEPVVTV